MKFIWIPQPSIGRDQTRTQTLTVAEMLSMRIGIDATFLEKKTSGANRYIQSIGRELAVRLGKDLCIYLPKGHSPLDFTRCTVREVPWRNEQKLARYLGGACYWPLVGRCHHLHVFHTPGHYIPPAMPCATVATIYDIRAIRDPHLCPAGRAAFLRTV